MTFVDSRHLLSTFFLSTLDFFTLDSRIFFSRLSTFTLESRRLLSTITLDSQHLLSTLDPRLLDTLQKGCTLNKKDCNCDRSSQIPF